MTQSISGTCGMYKSIKNHIKHLSVLKQHLAKRPTLYRYLDQTTVAKTTKTSVAKTSVHRFLLVGFCPTRPWQGRLFPQCFLAYDYYRQKSAFERGLFCHLQMIWIWLSPLIEFVGWMVFYVAYSSISVISRQQLTLFISFLGFTSTRLGLWSNLPKDTLRKTQRIQWARIQDPWITSQTILPPSHAEPLWLNLICRSVDLTL